MSQHTTGDSTAERLAVGLGLFSIGLGLAELTAPRSVARLIGVSSDSKNQSVLRAMGAREIGHGLAILARPHSSAPVWARVGGDALALSLLGSAMSSAYTDRQRTGAATAAVLGVTVLDLLCALQLGRREGGRMSNRGHVRVEYVTTINRPISEVYREWKDFERFPRFMRHLERVQLLNDRRSRWVAKAPAGMTVEWEADLVEDRPDERLSWRTVEGSQIHHTGTVTFEHAPGARGTEVRAVLHYSPPAGGVGRMIARLFGEEPEGQIREDLRRFKQLMETGEIPLSEGPGLSRPAQPPRRADEVRTLAGVER